MADISQDGIGEKGPLGCLPAGGVGRDGAQPGHAREPGVGPVLIVDFPDTSIGLVPASLDRHSAGFYRPPVVAAEVVVTGGRRKEQQEFRQRRRVGIAG